MSKPEKPSKADLMAERSIQRHASKQATRDEYAKMLEESYGKMMAASLLKIRKVERVDLEKLVPAPKEWNKYPLLKPDKRLEMKLSILANGLFTPIIIWDQGDGTYMILSGHNRTDLYREIRDEYQAIDLEELLAQAPDEETRELIENFDIRQFQTIEAFVHGKNDITESKAREIILDTNYIQRGEDKKIANTIIIERLDIVRDRRDLKGRTMDIVAKEMGISKSTVHRQWVLANKISAAMRNLYYEDRLSLVAVLRVQNLSKDKQDWIAEEYGDRLTNKMLQKVSEKRNYSKAELSALFDKLLVEEIKKKVTVSVQVEEEWADELRQAMLQWVRKKRLKDNGDDENPEENIQ